MHIAGMTLRLLASLLVVVSALNPTALAAQSEASTSERPCPDLIADLEAESRSSPDAMASAELTAPVSPKESCASQGPAADEAGAFEVIVEAGDLWFGTKELVIPSDGETTITLKNSGFAVHNLAVDDLDLLVVAPRGHSETVAIVDPTPGTYEFYCSISGHRLAGMVGTLIVQ